MEELIILLILGLLGLIVVFPIVAIAIAKNSRSEIEQLSSQVRQLREQINQLKKKFTDLTSKSKQDMPEKVDVVNFESLEPVEPPAEPQQPPMPTPGLGDAYEVETPATPAPPTPTPTTPTTSPAQQANHEKTADIDSEDIKKKTAGYKKVAAYRQLPAQKTPAKTKKPISIEELLSTKVLVWVAGVALALAGAYLVKYSFDQGILSPGVRLSLGSLFGVIMLITGEMMRKKYLNIAQSLSAAGVAVLFACNLAAVVLYKLFPQELGFVFMAAITALAVFLSLRQGIFVALLGLLGGFLLPAIIGGQDQHPGILFTYLLLVEVGLVMVARHRNWWPISALTLLCAMLWPIIWLLGGFYSHDTDTVWVAILLLGSFVAHVTSDLAGGKSLDETQAKISYILAFLSGLGGLILLGLMANVGQYTNMHWAFCGLLGAGCIAVARLNQRHASLAYLAAVIGAVLLLIWQKTTTDILEPRFATITTIFGLIYAAGAYASLWKSSHPGRWASFSTISAIAYLLIAYLVCDRTFINWRPDLPWWAISAIMAAAYTAASIPLIKARKNNPAYNYALAATLTGATALASLAMAFELERQWLTVGLAIELPLLAVINHWLNVKQLRAVASVLASIVAGRLLLNANIFDYDIGEHIIFNWLLYGYGVPAICMAFAAWLFGKTKKDRVVDLLSALAIAFTFALITLEIQHYFNPTNLKHISPNLFQTSTSCVAWMIFAAALLFSLQKIKSKAILYGASAVAAIAMLASVAGMVLLNNPMARAASPVYLGDTAVLNWLLPTYGLPAMLIFVLCWLWKRENQSDLANAAGAVGLLLLFALVGLEVQHGFHRNSMQVFSFTLNQWATFATAWLVFSGLLIAMYNKWRWITLGYGANAIAAAGILAAVIGQCLIANPLWSQQELGQTTIFNWLLYAYGLPAIILFALCWLWKRSNYSNLVDFAGAVALFLLFTLVGLEIQHGFQRDSMQTLSFSLIQWATFAIAWIIFSGALMAAYLKWRWVTLLLAANAIAATGILAVILGAGLIENPLWAHQDVGQMRIVNWLLYVYGLPALLIAGLGWLWQKADKQKAANVAGVLAIILAFALVNFEVRQWFNGTFLDGAKPGLMEMYCYSAAWILFACVMLAAGISTKLMPLRYASLAVMLLATCKVFVFDTGHLKDLYRVLSFLGLGISLLAIAFVYQRFVFKKTADEETENQL